MYVELVTDSIKNRGKFVPIGQVGTADRHTESYISLFPFDKNVLEYINIHGSITGYKGQHACLFICIDIDNENDLESSRQSSLDVIERLNTYYGISPNELFIYYSGNKGFHIYLVDRLIGIQNRFFDSIGAKCKSFVSETFAGINNVDTIIYEDHRIIRIPNSRHAKSNRYKIELTYDELKLDLDEIKTLANNPRHIKRAKLYSDIQVSEKLHSDFMSYFSGVTVENDKRKDATGFWGAMADGERNSGYHKQACALFSSSNLSEKSIFEIISALNSGANNPLPIEELRLIVRSASKVKNRIEQEAKLYTFHDAIPIWLDSIKPEKNKLTLAFDKFDDEMKGRLRGKVCDIIGYGGSKKSLLAQYIAICNIYAGQRVLYSSMEMGIPDLMTRAINMIITPERYSSSWELEMIDKTDHNHVLRVLDENASPILGDKFQMTDSGSMTSEKYDLMIQGIVARTGNVDILVVDGLGMMGGSGDETARYSQASKELKDLAKKWNMFVMLICHVSKGEDRESKDLSKVVRSSEKIIDNCDFYLSMAQHKLLVDGLHDYNNQFGNARLVNKRGSGRSIDVFFELDTQMLHFKEIGRENVGSSDNYSDIFNN